MTPPGTWIQRCASRVLPADVAARLLSPTVADMQWEVGVAGQRGKRARYVALARGYASLLRLTPVLMFHASRHLTHGLLSDDDRSLRRVLTCSAGAILFCTLLLILPPYPHLHRRTAEVGPRLVLLLVPQALGVALPVGFLIGSLIGLRTRSARQGLTLRRLLVGAVTIGLLTLVTIDWIVPSANQRYRELLTADLMTAGVARSAIHLEKGPNERSLRELFDAQTHLRADQSKQAYATRFAFHSRLALILSPVGFALLALGVVSIGRERWLAVAAAISLVTGVIVAVWFDGPADAWPPLIRAYTPVLLFGTWGGALLWCSAHWPDSDQPITNDRS